MEPCLFRHGKGQIGAAAQASLETLQWSHVFSDMVSVNPDDEAKIADWSFNGAMSFQTW